MTGAMGKISKDMTKLNKVRKVLKEVAAEGKSWESIVEKFKTQIANGEKNLLLMKDKLKEGIYMVKERRAYAKNLRGEVERLEK